MAFDVVEWIQHRISGLALYHKVLINKILTVYYLKTISSWFITLGICPVECCGSLFAETCRCDLVQMNMIFGCRSRIENVLRVEMRTFTLLCVGILLVQV